MRRLLWIAVLLGRFAGQEYVWTAIPPRRPTPIERPLVDAPGGVQAPWWRLR